MSQSRQGAGDGLHGLLTVDFAAQLRKTIMHSHTFPQQYMVECIRWCLALGAEKIAVESSAKELLIRWEGGTAPSGDLAALEELFGADRTWEVREAALEHFHGQKGLGLLSAWACTPKVVVLHACVSGGTRSIEYRPDFFASRLQAPPQTGTASSLDAVEGGQAAHSPMPQSLRLVRRGDSAAELTAVKDYCRFAAATIEFNGRPITVGSLPPEGLAGFRLKDDAGDPLGLVWIPRQGDLCRLVLLRRGVRWKMVATTTHRKGIIYEGAVEAEAVNPTLMQTLDHAARKLYGRLVDGLDGMNTPDRARVEHLLLNYARVSGDTRMLEDAKLFPLADGTGFLSLNELRLAGAEARVASVRDFVPSKKGGGAFPLLLVRLTDAQAAFLREMGVDVPTLGRKALSVDLPLWKRVSHGIRRAWGQISEGTAVLPERHTPDERSLLMEIEAVLASGAFVPTSANPKLPVLVELRTGKARASVHVGAARCVVRLRRGNRRLKDALARHAAGAPMRLLLPWLLEGEGRWVQLWNEGPLAVTTDSGGVSADAPTRPL